MDTMLPETRTTTARRILPLIDLTLLGDDDTTADVEALCDAATTPYGSVAAVCVWPSFIHVATKRLEGSGLGIAGVANFPEGLDDASRARRDAAVILEAGGDEIDVVFPWRSLQDGARGNGEALVRSVRDIIPDDLILKVSLETGELETPELIAQAARESIDGGADFLKTSTGKTARSATPSAARQLFEIVAAESARIGVKISGGVRTVDQAGVYLDLADEILGESWASSETLRIGASSLLAAVTTELGG
jgi:deoxyribose-phosphate aldolase